MFIGFNVIGDALKGNCEMLKVIGRAGARKPCNSSRPVNDFNLSDLILTGIQVLIALFKPKPISGREGLHVSCARQICEINF